MFEKGDSVVVREDRPPAETGGIVLPNFLIVGAAKAGTSKLWDSLRRQPQIFMPAEKELRFFGREDLYVRGIGWYASYFGPEEVSGVLRVGEASPVYSFHTRRPKMLDRIEKDLGRPQIIYVVRNPYKASYSFWRECIAKGRRWPSDFRNAVRTVEDLVDNVRYWDTIRRYAGRFGNEKVLVLCFEDMVADIESAVQRCCSFLGVDAVRQVEGEKLNSTESNTLEHPAVASVRSIPGFRAMQNIVPDGLRQRVKQWGRRPIVEDSPWDEQTLAWFNEQIGDEMARTLQYLGKPPDFWQPPQVGAEAERDRA